MKKIFLVSGVIIFVLALCFGALIYIGTANSQTAEHIVSENFCNIEISTTETDVALKPSEDGKTKIVCVELEKVKHEVFVEGDTLKISARDERAWYERVSIRSKPLSLTVYFPSGEYNVLSVENNTGDFATTAAFGFGELRVKMSTGNINIENARIGKADLSLSTGDISLTSVSCDGEIAVKVSTGNAVLTDVSCNSLVSDGSTGDVSLKNVFADESFNLKRRTGDIRFENCDANAISVETSTGDVSGSLSTAKTFVVKTSTGKIEVPNTTSGGRCEISTSTGDIIIRLV